MVWHIWPKNHKCHYTDKAQNYGPFIFTALNGFWSNEAKSQVDPPYQSEVSLESERFLFDISLCRADIKVGEVWKDPAKLGGTKTNSHETKTT